MKPCNGVFPAVAVALLACGIANVLDIGVEYNRDDADHVDRSDGRVEKKVVDENRARNVL